MNCRYPASGDVGKAIRLKAKAACNLPGVVAHKVTMCALQHVHVHAQVHVVLQRTKSQHQRSECTVCSGTLYFLFLSVQFPLLNKLYRTSILNRRPRGLAHLAAPGAAIRVLEGACTARPSQGLHRTAYRLLRVRNPSRSFLCTPVTSQRRQLPHRLPYQ